MTITREAYYENADRILRAASAEWTNVTQRILDELAQKDAPKPTLNAVIDTREISIDDALVILRTKNPFDYWRLDTAKNVEAKAWTTAFVSSYQAFRQMSNQKQRGLYVDAASPRLKELRTEISQLMHDLGQAGLHK